MRFEHSRLLESFNTLQTQCNNLQIESLPSDMESALIGKWLLAWAENVSEHEVSRTMEFFCDGVVVVAGTVRGRTMLYGLEWKLLVNNRIRVMGGADGFASIYYIDIYDNMLTLIDGIYTEQRVIYFRAN